MEPQRAGNTHTSSTTSDLITILSPSAQEGLVAVGSFAALSIVTTGLLLVFLMGRGFLRVVGYGYAGSGDSFKDHIWIFNLLLAQLVQSLGYVAGLHWSVAGQISASSGWCGAQAGYAQAGDLATGAFALMIAVQCVWVAAKGRKMDQAWVVLTAVVIWVFAVVLTVVGRAKGRDVFGVGAGDWCEISVKYEAERLWCHYFWLFLDAFGILTIFVGLMIHLISKSRFLGIHSSCRDELHHSHSSKGNRTEILYPYIYLALTLPLTIIRLISVTNTTPSTASHLAAAAISASTGWCFVLLYALTCHAFHTSTTTTTQTSCITTKDISHPMPFYKEDTPPYLGNTTVITGKGALDFRASLNSRNVGHNMSATSMKGDGFEAALEEGLGGIDGVRKKTTVSVFTSPAPPVNTPMEEGSVHSRKDSMDAWHTWV